MQPGFSPEVAAFLVRFETLIAEQHPGVEFRTMLPEQFACLLEVDGQETPLSLHDAFRHEQAFPSGFGSYVTQLIAEIREVGLDRVGDVDLAIAVAHVLPQVRSRAWLEARGCFGDSGLVYRRLNDELVTVYVIDDPQCMVFVCRAHLQRWRKSEADLHNLALANLERLDPARRDALRNVSGPQRVTVGDGYDAARVLLLDEIEGLLVAIPDRDLLWVGSESEVDLPSLMADTEELARSAAHPVSPHVFRVRASGLEAVQAEAPPR
ncbi:MAG: hypothetical protein KDE27_11455 [Planctomycetes bacterium]|nr:hypothetical protein [Planctomycetota bacterium]